jgi:tetratricopeptide (TPR) repeat protein
MRLSLKQTSVLVIAVLMLASCAMESVKKVPPPRPLPPPGTVPEEKSPAAETRRQVREMVRGGEYEDALVKIRDVSKGAPLGKDYGVLYENALNGLVLRGDGHMETRDYGQAGIAYRAALNNYPEDETARLKIDRSTDELQRSIDTCSGVLMEDGLRKYRAGELEAAIALWEKIILFDPDNAAALKARDTADTQLQNLRKLR